MIQDLKYQLKQQIIEELKLEDLKPEDIKDDAPLFGDGLGLDSIDALELVVLLEKYHGVKITDEETGKKAPRAFTDARTRQEESRNSL